MTIRLKSTSQTPRKAEAEIGSGNYDFRAVGTAGLNGENDGMAATIQTHTPAKVSRWTLVRLRWLERWLQRTHPKKSIAEHLATGRRGELAAYFHLRRQGYVIVAQGWRSHIAPGDLDLVGWDGARLCFIEVKTRTTQDRATAESAVDEDKRRTMRRLARRYLRRAGVPETIARFDVLTVHCKPGQEPETGLMRDAFGWQ